MKLKKILIILLFMLPLQTVLAESCYRSFMFLRSSVVALKLSPLQRERLYNLIENTNNDKTCKQRITDYRTLIEIRKLLTDQQNILLDNWLAASRAFRKTVGFVKPVWFIDLNLTKPQWLKINKMMEQAHKEWSRLQSELKKTGDGDQYYQQLSSLKLQTQVELVTVLNEQQRRLFLYKNHWVME